MPSQVWNSGPVHVYVAFYTAAGGYLGTCERAPHWRIRPTYAPVMNDLGGVILPFDLLYSGHDGLITCRFTRWNYTNMQAVEALGGKAGLDKSGAMGATVDLEKATAMDLKLVFAYAGGTKAAMSEMPSGIHFPLCTLEDYASQPGTGPNWIDATFHCRRIYSNGDWHVFDHDVSAVPAVE